MKRAKDWLEGVVYNSSLRIRNRLPESRALNDSTNEEVLVLAFLVAGSFAFSVCCWESLFRLLDLVVEALDDEASCGFLCFNFRMRFFLLLDHLDGSVVSWSFA